MPIDKYGVLKGHPIGVRRGTGASPHYQVHLVDETTDYRIAINVKSSESPSALLYLVAENFSHPITTGLSELPLGFHPLASTPGGKALDYVHGNLVSADKMRILPHDVPGPDNDLNEKIDTVFQRALGDETAVVYAFGQRWGPEPTTRDKIFGFLPGNGIHDIHMNQGNPKRLPKYHAQNGPYQDGGLLIHFSAVGSAPEQWVAVFLAFQSQSWKTEPVTGHPLEDGQGGGEVGGGGTGSSIADAAVRIVAALVNPSGPSPEQEKVTILNASPQALDLTGWALANKNNQKHTLSGSLAAGTATVVTMPQTVPLSNDGGLITLLDKKGLKVDGVSYTREQAKREGWTIVF